MIRNQVDLGRMIEGFKLSCQTEGKSPKTIEWYEEFTRECLAILVARKITNQEVIDILFHLFIIRGVPEHIRSNSCPEFTAKAVRK